MNKCTLPPSSNSATRPRPMRAFFAADKYIIADRDRVAKAMAASAFFPTPADMRRHALIYLLSDQD